MRTTEAKRLMADLAEREDLGSELGALEHDANAWWRRAVELGYGLSVAEVEELLASRGGLDDQALEAVAGGWEDGSGSGGGGTGDDGSGGGG